MSRAWQQFTLAMHALAGPGSQRERLIKACIPHLVDLKPKDLPAEIRSEFAKLMRDFSIGSPRIEKNTLASTIEALQEAEITAITASVIRMHDAITRYQPIRIEV